MVTVPAGSKDKNLENQSIQESNNQTVTTTDTVFSEAKNAETSWAAQIEEIEEAKLKSIEAKASQEPQRTHKTTANPKTNHVQTNNKTNVVNITTTTLKSNETASPNTEHMSDKKNQSASDTSPSQETTPKSTILTEIATTNDKESKPRQWSNLFPKLKGGKAVFTNSTPRQKICSKNKNTLILDIQKLENFSTNNIITALAIKLGDDLVGTKEISNQYNNILEVFQDVGKISAIKPLLYKGTSVCLDQWLADNSYTKVDSTATKPNKHDNTKDTEPEQKAKMVKPKPEEEPFTTISYKKNKKQKMHHTDSNYTRTQRTIAKFLTQQNLIPVREYVTPVDI
ncbi:24327_t:CDS:2 [Dentiscutata erythropus]|uniref:24327_t:CDS:1 n=1 Tax=Dentiscutata erythropus TaxID=1348616 RepID=A0A9N8WAL2_9GLOM|nr:24327_t:CDS:2 [Dentiscutata erythropus]